MLVGVVMTANISAGCCSAALEAEEELWACSCTAPPIMTLMAPYHFPPTPYMSESFDVMSLGRAGNQFWSPPSVDAA